MLDANLVNNPSIAVFAVNNSTGALSQISGSPFSIKPHVHVEGLATTPSTGFVYTADWFDHVIQSSRADPNTGALAQTVTLQHSQLQLPLGMLVDPAGKFCLSAI